jgi:hypothetical protein
MTLTADDVRHGTYNGYKNHGCRCDRCRTANTVAQRDYKRAWYRRQGHPTRAEYLESIGQQRGGTHGRIGTYNNGCRCEQCRRVATQLRSHYRARQKAAS